MDKGRNAVVSREALLQRRAELRAQERQAFANYNAVLGALQFCEHLIAESEAEHDAPKSAAVTG